MLWVPQDRQTRSGLVFVSWMPSIATLLRSSSFDFAPLIRASTAAEAAADGDDKHEHAPDDEAEFDTSAQPDAPPPPLPNLEDTSYLHPDLDDTAPPPAKRPRVDMRHHMATHQPDIKPPPRGHVTRRLKRNAKIAKDGQVPCASTVHAQVRPEATIPTSLATEELPAAHGGYAAKAKCDHYGAKKRRTLTELIAVGFQLIKWDGVTSRPIVDVHGRIIVVLAGRPDDPSYVAAIQEAYAAMEEERKRAKFPAAMRHHRRGAFPPTQYRLRLLQRPARPFSYAQRRAQRHNPTPAWQHERHSDGDLWQRWVSFFPPRPPPLCRIPAAFALWAPKVYEYYRSYDERLHAKVSGLERNFPKSIFAAAAFNFGPDVWTYKHRDILNTPFGMCVVTSMGPFDAVKGGHMVLWELKLVIEFPSASSILLPSATITHSNLPVQPGDARASFTQYTGGGLMRFVDNGFRTEAELLAEDPAEYERLAALKDTRWEMGLALLSTVDELLEPVVE
ncbi:hypothetical protein C8F04DRAFT_1274881 [Mycena alexandri]|uniref:Uncharacterized protein n=2 Tax=Mycena alexandri TaxID=1745969 RepID=A0AAD6S5D2_9AGAR|nr:hypothetical protein C8F04DRAFT_1274881 [Mycena alexandri]